MAEDHLEKPFGIGAGTGELVGVADSRGLDLDQYLAELRPLEIDRLDHERIARLVANGSLGLHAEAPSMAIVRASLEQPDQRRHLCRCAKRKDALWLTLRDAACGCSSG